MMRKAEKKGIDAPGRALESKGFSSFTATRGEVWILTLPALALSGG